MFHLKVNRQRPTSVMQKLELKIPTLVEWLISPLFSKSVLDIRTRLVVTAEPETKWMPNSDSTSKRMPKCRIWGQYDLQNYFYSCLKIAVFRDFLWLLHIKMVVARYYAPEGGHLRLSFYLENEKKSPRSLGSESDCGRIRTTNVLITSPAL